MIPKVNMSIAGECSTAKDDKNIPRVATMLPVIATLLIPYQSVRAEATGDSKNNVPTESEPTKSENNDIFENRRCFFKRKLRLPQETWVAAFGMSLKCSFKST